MCEAKLLLVPLVKRISFVMRISILELLAVTRSSAVNTEKSALPFEIFLKQSNLESVKVQLMSDVQMVLFTDLSKPNTHSTLLSGWSKAGQ